MRINGRSKGQTDPTQRLSAIFTKGGLQPFVLFHAQDSILQGDIGEDENKFLTAVAADDILATHIGRQAGTQTLQQHIASLGP